MAKAERKYYGRIAKALRHGEPLHEEIRDDLVRAFEEIAAGASADEAFNLKNTRGHSERDERHKENLTRIFHWVLSAIDKDEGHGLNQSQALLAASSLSRDEDWTHPKTKQVFPATVKGYFKPITYESLRKAWYDPRFAHLKRHIVSDSDWDSLF